MPSIELANPPRTAETPPNDAIQRKSLHTRESSTCDRVPAVIPAPVYVIPTPVYVIPALVPLIPAPVPVIPTPVPVIPAPVYVIPAKGDLCITCCVGV